ncbi:inositol oxygenase [Marssonina coronariae]|uniref:Inositol oxygenase n=1 Tax=Diplocarpon coronariae TaxID=2795749 RepID=A0A218YZB6_9HELO|nr:inositol oxygenase [Marssonina coronariae]
MAPSATGPYPVRDGAALEETSDRIDAINVMKAALKSKAAASRQEKHTQTNNDLEKDLSRFREYLDTDAAVKSTYAEQHTKQTVAYNERARARFYGETRAEMSIWAAMEKLNTFIDESDPDTSLSQIEHLLQSAEAMRRAGEPRWMQLTGLIHDLGKLLFFYGAEGQWDVVGDTFPVGCAFSSKIVYPDTFAANPDLHDPRYSSRLGMYEEGCGLDKVMLSWGHDEYLYLVVRDQSTLPEEALAMIRYHSFYPWHSEGEYTWLMDEKDHRMLEAVQRFNPYDLYSKSDEVPSVEELKPYYLDLIKEFFPNDIIRCAGRLEGAARPTREGPSPNRGIEGLPPGSGRRGARHAACRALGAMESHKQPPVHSPTDRTIPGPPLEAKQNRVAPAVRGRDEM